MIIIGSTQKHAKIDYDGICPCLTSAMGQGGGHVPMFFEEEDMIINPLKGKTKYGWHFEQNVKNVISKKHKHNFDNYLERMEELGYTNYYQVLNAKDYGIPQNRERVFTVSIREDIWLKHGSFWFPPKQELKLKLKDMLEEQVDEKYYLDNKWLNDIRYNNNTVCETRYDEGIRTFKNNICGSLRTIDACGNKCVIQIKNATKQGYLEATEGDGIDISSRMQYHRGNVQKDSIQTITTSGGNDRGVVVKEEKWKDLD